MVREPLFSKGLGLSEAEIGSLKRMSYKQLIDSEMKRLRLPSAHSFHLLATESSTAVFDPSSSSINSSSLTKQDMDSFESLKDVCSICCCPYTSEKEQLIVLPCHPHHFFHQQCITEWLVRQDSCPLCKQQVVGKRQAAGPQYDPRVEYYF